MINKNLYYILIDEDRNPKETHSTKDYLYIAIASTSIMKTKYIIIEGKGYAAQGASYSLETINPQFLNILEENNLLWSFHFIKNNTNYKQEDIENELIKRQYPILTRYH